MEFKFFSRILHLLDIQDESLLYGESAGSCLEPSSAELQELVFKYLRKKEKKNKSMKKVQAAGRALEVEKMKALHQCLEGILEHNVYQASLS